MASFKYTGRNASGSQVKGSMDAANTSAVAEQLMRKSITPILISAGTTKQSKSFASKDVSEIFGLSRVSLDELIIFSRQMYALMRSGVPILRSINGMEEASNSAPLKKALADIASQLQGGYTLSSALNQHPKIFGSLFVSLIHVGENTGQLEESFLQLTTYLEREQATRKRIKTALRYPTMVMIALAGALVILNIFVIPTFANMFAKLGADLPLATKFLINSSNLFLNYWPYMLVAGVGAYFALLKSLKTKSDG
jgi:MSHA biogenesis protein MshG